MNQRAWDLGRSGYTRTFVLAPSRETLVRRAVRDHQHTAAVDWIVTTPVPDHETAMHDALHAGYRTWLRTTAAAGIASALLVAPAGTAAASSAQGSAVGTGQGGGGTTDASALLLQGRQGQPLDAVGLTDPLPLITGVPEDQPPPAGLVGSASQPPLLEVPPLTPDQPLLPVEQSEPADSLTPQARTMSAEPDQIEPSAAPAPEIDQPAAAQASPPSQRWVTMVERALDPAAAQAPTATPTMTARAEVTPTPTMGWSYEVQPGDTLWGISEQLWTDRQSNADVDRTWRVLYEWNSKTLGSDPDELHPGQVLEIPVAVEGVDTAETW